MRFLVACLFLLLGFSASHQPLVAQENEGRVGAISAFDQSIEAAKSEMMADPEKALSHSERALELAQAQTTPSKRINRATALWLKAESLIGLNRLDDAGTIATEAVAIVEQAEPNTKLHGDLLRSRGAVLALSGKVQEALADYQSAHDIFRDAGIPRSRAIALQDIGQIYWEAGDYERTLRYYTDAVEIYNDDPGFALSNHNNLGETYKMLERYAEAEQEYEKAIVAAREIGSPMLETRILSNLALVQIEQGKLAEATGTTDRALALTRNGEAAGWRSFVFGVQARIASERGEFRNAARYLDQTFEDADFASTDLVYREFHALGATVFDRIGQPQKALAHLRAFQRLDSQARDLVSSTSSQLMAARFDFANQNLRISQLKQGQLERDIKIERQRTEFRTTVFTGFAIASTIVLILVLLAFFSIRRSRNEVRDANTELHQANTDLERALKAKTDFLAMTSHEIRTPLNGILGTSQVLLANRAIDEDSIGRVKLIHNAGETMKALVDDLLDVAKMDSGEVTLEIAPVSIPAILADAAELWRGKFNAKGLDFSVDTGDVPERIETDGGRIRQLVFNLLSNAAKFTRKGTVELAAAYDPDSKELTISVSDSGIGIAESEKDRVFEAFHQVDNTTTREFGGTGLGLSICQNLAHALGGRIELISELGEGSTFKLVLPVDEVEGASISDPQAPNALEACRVALIEANAIKQSIMVGLVAPHAKDVLPFFSADDCEGAVRAGRIDHIVLDAASVAGADCSIESLRAFLEFAQSNRVPTTLLFAPSDALPMDSIMRLAHTQLVLKPVAGDALITCLKDHYDTPATEQEDSDYASAA